MSALQSLIPLIFTVSLAALVIAVGMDAGWDDLLHLFRRPLLLVKAILAVNVIVPLAAVLLVFVFPLTPIAKAGVLLMAVSPVPPLVPGKELKVGAGKPYAYGLYVALILLAIVFVPLTVAIVARLYGADVAIPPSMIARNVALTVLAPLAVGLAIGRLAAPAFVHKFVPILRTVAMILLLLALIPMLVVVWPAMLHLIGNGTVLAMALTAAIALGAGHLLGGPNLPDRAALAVTAATRHPGIALMIATANNADKRVQAAIVGMLLVGLIVSIPYQLWLKRRAPMAAAELRG